MRATMLLAFVLLASSVSYSQSAPGADSELRIVNGPVVENVTDSSATVAWSTTVSAGTTVRYGTRPGELDRSKQAPWGGYTHRITLDGLQPGTKYYFLVESGQGQGTGGTARSSVAEFTTKPQAGGPAQSPLKLAITIGPHIERTTDTSAVISWTTNVSSSTMVKYGTDPDKLEKEEKRPWGGTEHRVELTGLKPDTLYHYQAHSAEGEGAAGEAASRVQSFRTPVTKP